MQNKYSLFFVLINKKLIFKLKKSQIKLNKK